MALVIVLQVGQTGQHAERVLRLTARGGRTTDKHLMLVRHSIDARSQRSVRAGGCQDFQNESTCCPLFGRPDSQCLHKQ